MLRDRISAPWLQNSPINQIDTKDHHLYLKTGSTRLRHENWSSVRPEISLKEKGHIDPSETRSTETLFQTRDILVNEGNPHENHIIFKKLYSCLPNSRWRPKGTVVTVLVSCYHCTSPILSLQDGQIKSWVSRLSLEWQCNSVLY